MRFFNTLTRQKEAFTPLHEKHVGVYSCGPTVYGPPHIGNLRAFIFADTLRRSLEFSGYIVTQVMNITDVGHLTSDANAGEDKLEKGARASGKTVWEVARFYEEQFLDALEKLNIKKPTHLPRATEHVGEQLELIKTLTAKGFTYETSDGIYFDTSKFKDYGQLSRQKLEDKVSGARVAVKDEKKNPADFALWKFCVGENLNHTMRWDFETGTDLSGTNNQQLTTNNRTGFPGWHIECSAMSLKYLAPTALSANEELRTKNEVPLIDIHTGGIDHVPVHHENEIAQSEAATGKKFVNFWLHNEFLTIAGGKMSKSLGNLYTLEDLKNKGFDSLAFRLLCLGTHYRQKLNFSWDALKASAIALTKLREHCASLPAPEEPLTSALEEFSAAISDDLNTPQALAIVWELIKNSTISPAVKSATLAKFDTVLGLRLTEKIPEEKITLTPAQENLLAERATARAEKNWERSDEIRDEFLKAKLVIEDTSKKQIIKQIKS